MRKGIIILCLLVGMVGVRPLAASGVWRLGVNGGATWNHYAIDKQYMTDYRFPAGWGGTAGVYTQYNFFDWLGLRVGAYYAQRNYRHTRAQYSGMLNVRYENNYMLFPVTVDFSFGGKKVRGYVDAGVYGGAWLMTHRSGQEYVTVGRTGSYTFSETMPFNAQRDERGDFGYTGGVGILYQFHPHWMMQVEAVCYYSVVSATKQYMKHVKDFRYHTTVGLQAGVSFVF